MNILRYKTFFYPKNRKQFQEKNREYTKYVQKTIIKSVLKRKDLLKQGLKITSCSM